MRFLIHVLLVVLVLNLSTLGNGKPQVPCFFIFGASYYDNGNNNRLLTLARANFRPYGIDFPDGPTGRFTNGRTTGDFLAQFLGFEDFIPSFADAMNHRHATHKDDDILKGVNYASGSSGILKETSKHVGARICMDGQLQYHQTVVSSIESLLGKKDSAEDHLNQCLYTVAMGDNDYIGNYFFPLLYKSSSRYSPQQFATLLIQQYSQQLTTLYNLGARKIALFGIPPLDCSPSAGDEVSATGKCAENKTRSISIFNTNLKQLVDGLNKNLTNARFMFVNTYGISRASLPHFKVTDAACCKVEEKIGITTCIPEGKSCEKRNEYMWWDAVHQTEAAYKLVAERAYTSQSPFDTYPTDISRLVQS